MYGKQANILSANTAGTSTIAVIKELVSEIHYLQQENLQLRRRMAASARNTKRCFKCGREGHLERACCERLVKYDGNWRAIRTDIGPGTVNESLDEGFVSPVKLMEPGEQTDVAHAHESDQLVQLGIDAGDDGDSDGKCDQQASFDVSTNLDTSSVISGYEPSCESGEEATDSQQDDGIYDDTEDDDDGSCDEKEEGCARTRIYAGKCDQQLSLDVSTKLDTS